MSKKLTLSQACEGMVRYKQATGKSENTISEYRNTFKKLALFFPKNPLFVSITRAQLIDFFAWLQNDYISNPAGVAPRGKRRLGAKTIRNIHTNLSALWHWGVDEGFVKSNIVRKIDPPPTSPPVIQPYTKDEIEQILKGCLKTRAWSTRPNTVTSRATGVRDKAIIMTLLDTGVRASELCGICYEDINMSSNSIKVSGKGPGRDGKERLVYFGRRTGQAIWKSLLPRIDQIRPNDPLFVVGADEDWRPLTRQHLRLLVSRIGKRVGVNKAHPHRFRHTFAINYLRNDGDVFTLQKLLGHSNLYNDPQKLDHRLR
ncbi:MAG: tyrosine-type recombinase/integrase [Anaerolineae bacterium]|nr:tyrosine-type recombinase/integrase [Anaerolineae bacterium]